MFTLLYNSHLVAAPQTHPAPQAHDHPDHPAHPAAPVIFTYDGFTDAHAPQTHTLLHPAHPVAHA